VPTISDLVVVLRADTKLFSAGLSKAQAQTSGFGSAALGAAKVATGAFVLAGAASLKFGYDFDQAFQRISAISNASAKDIEAWKKQVLALSGETAQAPKELADALFFLASAGLKSSQIMPTLEAAAKASAVGLGETADIASILASALNAYSDSGLTAAAATDTLVAAVREGRAEPEEFAGALGRILPIASTIGVTFDQVTASLAALSNIGLDVNEGVTAMRGVFQALAAPGTMAAKAMESVGISAQEMLDVISEQGIIGALRTLHQAVKQNTTGTAEYNNVMRQIVPNVRSLTGVFGLTVQEAKKVNDIFNSVRESTGSLDDAFETTAETASFQMNKSLNELSVTLTELGATTLPVAADALGTFTTGLQEGAAILGFGANIEDVLARTLELLDAWRAGAITATELDAALQHLSTTQFKWIDLADETQAAIDRAVEAEKQEIVNRRIAQAQWESYSQVLQSGAGAVREVGNESEDAAHKVRLFGNLGEKAAKQFKEEIVESTRVAIGQFEKVGDAFEITPTELRRHLEAAIQIARRFQADLREIIRDPELTRAQKQALAALPPEYRRAFVAAGEEGKKELAQQATELARLNSQKFREITKAAEAPARTGGKSVGHAMAEGMQAGIREGAAGVAAEAATTVTRAIDAARRAARASSPSKEMQELGNDLIRGLLAGLREMQPELEHEMSGLEDRLNRLQSIAGNLRGAIAGGFGTFLDLSGALETGDLAGFIQGQLGAARQFASSLDALRRQGAGPGLLSAAAGQGLEFTQALLQLGPEQIKGFNRQYEAIRELQRETSNHLTQRYFGERIDKIREELRGVRDILKNIERSTSLLERLRESEESLGRLGRPGTTGQLFEDGSIRITVQGFVGNNQELARVLRNELNKLGDRNAGTGLH
jgi:TP901 family phage tail tape measure protein